MNSAFALVTDDEGLVVMGDDAAVERFLTAEDLPSRELSLPRLTKVGDASLHVIASGGIPRPILAIAGKSPARPRED